MKRIEYKKGDVVGDYGCVYLHEANPYTVPSTGRKMRRARFKCNCGNEYEAIIRVVTSGKSKSCGCRHRGNIDIKYYKGDVLGHYRCVYLRETAPNYSSSGVKRRMAIFRCSCGMEFESDIGAVKGNNTKSCGCRKIESVKTSAKTHGLRYDPLYSRWLNIKQRCYNPDNPDYQYYGAQGISICDEWRDDFKAYRDHLMSLPYALKNDYTVDRIINTGNYEPDNVRWATRLTQAQNRGKQKSNTSGYVGVSFDKSKNKYTSYIRVENETIVFGDFITDEEALKPRNDYIKKHNLTEYKIQHYEQKS